MPGGLTYAKLVAAALKRFAIVVALISIVVVVVIVREKRSFEAPLPDLHATASSAIVARGKYLVTGAAQCTSCHGEDLAGGRAFHLPIGTIYAPNITPMGIGNYTDAELARLLRYGVHPSGRAMLPFMTVADSSDEDLTAIVSYLRSVPPIERVPPASDYNLLGHIARAFMIRPRGPTKAVPTHVTPGPTTEYGDYLANAIANCGGCHTKRNMRTGVAQGVSFAGGSTVESRATPGVKFVTPNLTPDPDTGVLQGSSEDAFVGRFKNAPSSPSPMPWENFKNLSDDDLRALYRYFRSLPPATRGQEL